MRCPKSFQAQSVAPAAFPATRALYWSVRRELWENRSIYIAPLAVAAVALFAFSMGAIGGIWEKALRLDPAQSQRSGYAAIRYSGRPDDAHRYYRECVLLPRCAALRARRSQHPVLEVAASIRSHYRAREGEHSPRRSAATHLCDHLRDAVASCCC